MLEQFMDYYRNLDITIDNNIQNEKVAVIVEPRKHKYLISVIKQVMSKFDKTWNLRIFGSDMNESYVNENIKGNYEFINMGINDLISPDAYSLLLQSNHFWNKIKEEHIIIFQTDSFIINNDYEIPTKYPYLGARYTYTFNGKRVDEVNPIRGNDPMCGGFSYRQKSAMIDCINNVTYDDIIQYRTSNNLSNDFFIDKFIIAEDVFFEHALTVLGYPSPSHTVQDEPAKFCIYYLNNVSEIDPLTVFGIHPFDKFNKHNIDYICGELLTRVTP
tara:strand:+ start:3442 stop:4260 length:819 start_codon:yes stop_codon:yes gene_type:complete